MSIATGNRQDQSFGHPEAETVFDPETAPPESTRVELPDFTGWFKIPEEKAPAEKKGYIDINFIKEKTGLLILIAIAIVLLRK